MRGGRPIGIIGSGTAKARPIAGFTQATFLAGAAVVLAIQSIERFIFPEPFAALGVGMAVIVCSLIAATALVAMQTWAVRKTGSTAIAFVIAAYIMWNARGIAGDVLTQLLDRDLPEDARQRIQAALPACSGVSAVHDLRTRHAGDRAFVEFHLEVDGNLTVTEGHTIGDAAEMAVKTLLPETVEVAAHLEPFGIDDERLDDRVNETATE